MSDIPRDPAPEEEVDLENEETEAEGDDVAQADDDAGGDDEAEAEGEDEEVAAEPAPRRGRGSETIRTLRTRAQAAERERDEERRQRQEDRQRLERLEQQVRTDPAAQQRAESEWLERYNMSAPDVQAQMILARGRQELGAVLQQQNARAEDAFDKQEFRASFAEYPHRRGYAERVEETLRQERARGSFPSREAVFKHLYASDVEQRAMRAKPRQQAAAQRRVASQTTRPTNGRGDVSPASRRPQPGSLEADRALIDAAIARGEDVF